jgi:ABC-type glycerol-3-phosphate transport system permease component
MSKAESGGRFARYIIERGWAHLVLLTGLGIFVFPFVWMLSTSVKTDEELPQAQVLPRIPQFRQRSPYVRPADEPQRPGDVPRDRWDALLPAIVRLSEAAVERYQDSNRQTPFQAQCVAPLEHRQAAGRWLVDRLVAKLDVRLWSANEQNLLAEYRQLLTPGVLESSLRETLARLEIGTIQVRTLQSHLHTEESPPSSPGPRTIRAAWTVESGPGRLVRAGGALRLEYDFARGSPDAPVVLRCDFAAFPAVDPADLHKLAVAIKADDSWHRIDATLDWGEHRWASRQTTYLSQHRPMTITFQPPTFDDTTDRARTWIPLAIQGPRPDSQRPPGAGALRLILSSSSTAQAIAGKVERNYRRAFLSVPFWKFVGNSVLLVVLTMAGALFSASFVAYAFARLHWPGRGVALVLLLATMMLPSQVTMIPSFMIWREVGWYNTLNPLWVPAWFGSAFFIFLMTQQMKTIPRELEEAARLDGLNPVQTWWYIILPQVKPTLAAIAIMTFQGAWNEFMGPLVYLRDQDKFPLSLGLFGMRVDQGGDWTLLMAGNMLMTLPVIIVFFLFQRYFIQGMTMSGMKG